MKKALFLIILILTFSCEKSENQIYVEELKWSLSIPNEFERVLIKNFEKTKEKGIKLIESAYPKKKVTIVSRNLFNYNNGKFNSIKAQITELNSEQTFEDEFKRANEIVIKSLTKKKPKSEFEQNVNKVIIDGLEFQTFSLKTLNKSGKNYELKVYSKMFGIKKLDIIIVNNDNKKKELIENRILSSKFE
tara:strand:- start:832 stop:1401 length:570 start_codon:yes stop_codon:yes gene_type:complete